MSAGRRHAPSRRGGAARAARAARPHLLRGALVAPVALVLLVPGTGLADHLGRLGVTAALHGLRDPDGPARLDRPAGSRADGTVTYLVVGSDGRTGTPDRGITGVRADSVTLWVTRPGRAGVVLALPRDLRVAVAGHADAKLGGTLDDGPGALVDAVRALTGLPVHHLVEVDFTAFRALVDAVGGVDVELARPLRDPTVGLDLPAGRVRLDGATALALCRGRSGEEQVDGDWVPTAGGDLERIGRQQQVLAALLPRLSALRSPAGLLRLATAARDVAVDRRLSARDVQRLRAAVGPRPGGALVCTLPTRPAVPAERATSPFPPYHPGSTGFRVLEPAAAQVLAVAAEASPGTAGPLPAACHVLGATGA